MKVERKKPSSLEGPEEENKENETRTEQKSRAEKQLSKGDKQLEAVERRYGL